MHKPTAAPDIPREAGPISPGRIATPEYASGGHCVMHLRSRSSRKKAADFLVDGGVEFGSGWGCTHVGPGGQHGRCRTRKLGQVPSRIGVVVAGPTATVQAQARRRDRSPTLRDSPMSRVLDEEHPQLRQVSMSR